MHAPNDTSWHTTGYSSTLHGKCPCPCPTDCWTPPIFFFFLPASCPPAVTPPQPGLTSLTSGGWQRSAAQRGERGVSMWPPSTASHTPPGPVAAPQHPPCSGSSAGTKPPIRPLHLYVLASAFCTRAPPPSASGIYYLTIPILPPPTFALSLSSPPSTIICCHQLWLLHSLSRSSLSPASRSSRKSSLTPVIRFIAVLFPAPLHPLALTLALDSSAKRLVAKPFQPSVVRYTRSHHPRRHCSPRLRRRSLKSHSPQAVIITQGAAKSTAALLDCNSQLFVESDTLPSN